MKVKVDNPAFPEGHLLAIDGLGVFENGKEEEVSDEQLATFEAATGKKLDEAFASDSTVFIDGRAGGSEESQPTEAAAAEPKEEGVSE